MQYKNNTWKLLKMARRFSSFSALGRHFPLNLGQNLRGGLSGVPQLPGAILFGEGGTTWEPAEIPAAISA